MLPPSIVHVAFYNSKRKRCLLLISIVSSRRSKCNNKNMGKTNKSDVQEDENLATEVSKYPCLYDKTDKGYKERDRKQNAWAKIEEELGYEKGI